MKLCLTKSIGFRTYNKNSVNSRLFKNTNFTNAEAKMTGSQFAEEALNGVCTFRPFVHAKNPNVGAKAETDQQHGVFGIKKLLCGSFFDLAKGIELYPTV